MRQFTQQVSALSADDSRVATLEQDGVVRIVTAGGRPIGAIPVGRARALSLRAGAVTVLTRHGTVDVYEVATGTRIHSWRVPAGATSLDTQFGVAVLTTRHDVLAVSLKTGRTVGLLHTRARVLAQIEAPGVAIATNAGRHGSVRFLPMSLIQARLVG